MIIPEGVSDYFALSSHKKGDQDKNYKHDCHYYPIDVFF